MSRADISAGKAHVELYVKNSKFVKGLNAASKQLGSLGKDIVKIGVTFQAAGAAILAPLGAAVAKFAEFGDSIHKMSIRTGTSAEFLSEMGFAAEQSGASLDDLGNALFRMRRRVANATTEMGPAQRALTDLGLAAEELTRLKPEQQFAVIADRLSGVANESLRAQYAFEIFGDGAKSLLPLLSEGSVGMAKLRQEARDLGLTMSGDDANAAAAFSDAMNRLKTSMKGVVLAIGRELAPVLTGLQDRVTKFIVELGRWIRDNSHLVRIIAATGAALFAFGSAVTAVGIPLISLSATLSALTTVFMTVAKTVGFVGGMFTLLLNPIGLVVTAIGLLSVHWLTATEDGQKAASAIGSAFESVWAFVRRVVAGISAALTDGRLELAANIAATAMEVAFTEAIDRIKEHWRDAIVEMVSWLSRLHITAREAVLGDKDLLRDQRRAPSEGAAKSSPMDRLESLLRQAGAPAAGRQQAKQREAVRDETSRMTDIDETVRQQNADLIAAENEMRQRIAQHLKQEADQRKKQEELNAQRLKEEQAEFAARKMIASAMQREQAQLAKLQAQKKGADVIRAFQQASQQRMGMVMRDAQMKRLSVSDDPKSGEMLDLMRKQNQQMAAMLHELRIGRAVFE